MACYIYQKLRSFLYLSKKMFYYTFLKRSKSSVFNVFLSLRMWNIHIWSIFIFPCFKKSSIINWLFFTFWEIFLLFKTISHFYFCFSERSWYLSRVCYWRLSLVFFFITFSWWISRHLYIRKKNAKQLMVKNG